jgi:hypothetical protein
MENSLGFVAISLPTCGKEVKQNSTESIALLGVRGYLCYHL